MTDDQRRELRAVVATPLPSLRPCSDEGFDRCMAALNTMPSRRAGADEGKVLLEVYRRQLGGLPSAQLVWIVDTALQRLKWFPAVAELLEIAAEWRRDDAHTKALARAEVALRQDRQARYDAAMTALARGEMDQADIDALPLTWAEAAVRLGWLVGDAADGFSKPQPVAPRSEEEEA